MQLSSCVFISSIAYYFDPALWWFDSAFALAISLLISREAYEMLKAAYTGQDTCCAPPTKDSWLIKQIKTRTTQHNNENEEQTACFSHLAEHSKKVGVAPKTGGGDSCCENTNDQLV